MNEESEVAPEPSPEQIMAGYFGDEEPERIEDFDERILEDVNGLMFLGYLEEEFYLYGHHFVMRTLRGNEELLASLVCKDWIETLGQTRAWAWAQVSLSLISVDGDEDFCPRVTKDPKGFARARFQWCTSQWVWRLGEKLFERYLMLQKRQSEAMESMEDLSAGNPLTSQPYVGSSTDRAPLPEVEMEDIRDVMAPQDSPGSNPGS